MWMILLTGIFGLLATPGFWYCMTALSCATIIAEGMGKVAEAIREHTEALPSPEPTASFLDS